MGEERERPCAPVAVPAALAAEVAGHSWWRDTVGESVGAVYRLGGAGGEPGLYLKHGRGAVAADVADEAARLAWLAGRIEVPEVRGFVGAPDEAWLLTTAIPGPTAWQALTAAGGGNRLALIETLTEYLRPFHALPACPFSGDRLTLARRRVETGLVDTADFDPEHGGWTAAQVWAELTALLPLTPDPVVTHGDFSLDNLIMRDGAVAACLDVGRLGMADRYQDLAILWHSLNDFDPALGARMLDRYGVGRGDADKLRFHLLLDELF